MRLYNRLTSLQIGFAVGAAFAIPHFVLAETDSATKETETNTEASAETPPEASAEAPAESPTEPPEDPRLEQLEREVELLTDEVQRLTHAELDRELDELRRAAEATASAAASADEESGRVVFSSGNRGRQALNPEISLTADAGGRLVATDLDPGTLADGSGFLFRVVGLHFEADLDPYSFTKVAVGITPTGVGFGEGYATWVRILPGTNLTLGKFRQQFGVVNRWHTPAMDQFDRPLALTRLLGPEGLNAIGMSLEWRLPPLLASSHTLTFEVTNPMNPVLFTGEMVGIPTGLARLRNYWDLGDTTYLELGLSGHGGINEAEDLHTTLLGGVDLTFNWTPLDRERYRGVSWRTELLAVNKATAVDDILAFGGFSYVNARLSQTLEMGLRGDLTQALEAGNGGEWDWQIVPYLTWWQSAWVKVRLQASHLQPSEGDSVQSLVLQCVWSMGPHKHERY